MSFTFTAQKIPELILIEPKVFVDERGFFLETFKSSSFKEKGIPDFVQENHSYSKKNVLRGLHYQVAPKAQGKLVRCVCGEIFDVAVDLHKDSKTYLSWFGVNLSADNHKQLYIPEGFAHGFCVLSNKAEVVYKCTAEYSPEHEMGIIWNDPSICIKWPVSSPILSEKDKQYKSHEKNY